MVKPKKRWSAHLIGSDDEDLIGASENACSARDLAPRLFNGQNCSDPITSGVVTISPIFRTSAGDIPLSLCSGSIISPNHILTSAHCFDNFSPLVDDFIVRLGNSNNNIIEVSRVFLPSSYDGRVASAFDIAIVELSAPTDISPIPILLSRSANIGGIATAFGYGFNNYGEASILQAVNFKLSDEADGNFIAEFNDIESGICSGDSGGPLIQTIDGTKGIIGINSYGSHRDGEGTEECTDVDGEISGFLNIQRSEIIDFILRAAPNATTM